jgi:exopolysaccharide production protein ExoZ
VSQPHSNLATVQALRAIAALLVVAYHSLGAWTEHVMGEPADNYWPNGSAGVDIFFVISGLVMVISADRLAANAGAWRIFLRQRLVRIVPLYWIVTTAKVAAVLALPMLVARTHLDLPYVVGSYLLLPVKDATGQFFPVLPVGWTLTYEMLFYALVVIALALRVHVLAVAGPALAAFVLVGVFGGLDGFANTIVAEFLFGVLIGVAVGHGVRLRASAAIPLMGLGFAIILMGPVVSGVLRPITWGIPAACIVAGAVSLEGRLAPITPRWLLDAGDASYSIYLTHGFIVPVVYILAVATGPTTLVLPVTLVAGLLGSAVIGRLSFAWLERPMLRLLRRRSAAPVAALVG